VSGEVSKFALRGEPVTALRLRQLADMLECPRVHVTGPHEIKGFVQVVSVFKALV